MAGVRYSTPNAFEVDPTGVPYAGGQLFFYVTGSTTPKATYADVNLTVPNANPVVADATGHFGSIFLATDVAYAVAAYGPNTTGIPSTMAIPQGAQLWTEDPVGPAAGGVTQNTAGIIGEMRIFAGQSGAIPAQWYLCYGQALSRTTYVNAFNVIGTLWGSGDGSTTFNLPDMRGRAVFGVDNMGGNAAGRVTSAVSSLNGSVLGATGGDQHAQPDTLTATSVVNDPSHVHVIAGGLSNTGGSGNTVGGGTIAAANLNTQPASTGITVTTTVATSLAGVAQNMPPAAMAQYIIYLGA